MEGGEQLSIAHRERGVLANMIGGVVAGTSGGGLQFMQFLMGGDKEGFELGPGLVGWIMLLPRLTIVIE